MIAKDGTSATNGTPVRETMTSGEGRALRAQLRRRRLLALCLGLGNLVWQTQASAGPNVGADPQPRTMGGRVGYRHPEPSSELESMARPSGSLLPSTSAEIPSAAAERSPASAAATEPRPGQTGQEDSSRAPATAAPSSPTPPSGGGAPLKFEPAGPHVQEERESFGTIEARASNASADAESAAVKLAILGTTDAAHQPAPNTETSAPPNDPSRLAYAPSAKRSKGTGSSEPAPTSSSSRRATPAGAAAASSRQKRSSARQRYSIDDEFLVEGRLEKPSAYYILRRSGAEYDWARMDAKFLPLVLESVQDPLF